MRALLRDNANRFYFGPDAPIYAERIWVNPFDITVCLTGLSDRFAGKVVGDPWPPEGGTICEFRDIFKVQACFEHWKNEIPWKETGIYDHLLQKIKEHPRRCIDGCSNIGDVQKRYKRLDDLFNESKRKGGFPEIKPRDNNWAFREKDGITIHIGPDGRLYFGGNGCHRFSIALVLRLTWIPAKLGCVHRDALPLLPLYREKERKDRKRAQLPIQNGTVSHLSYGSKSDPLEDV